MVIHKNKRYENTEYIMKNILMIKKEGEHHRMRPAIYMLLPGVRGVIYMLLPGVRVVIYMLLPMVRVDFLEIQQISPPVFYALRILNAPM